MKQIYWVVLLIALPTLIGLSIYFMARPKKNISGTGETPEEIDETVRLISALPSGI